MAAVETAPRNGGPTWSRWWSRTREARWGVGSDLHLAGWVSRLFGGPARDVGLHQLHELGADLRTVLGGPHHRPQELPDLSHRPRVLALGGQHDLLRGRQCRCGQFGCAAHGPAAQSEAARSEYLPDDLLPAGNPAGGRGRSRLPADPFPGNRTRQLDPHQGRRPVRHHRRSRATRSTGSTIRG